MKHGQEKPFACDICDKRFNYKISMLDHKKKHFAGEKVFKCDGCDKSFAHNSKLKEHKKECLADFGTVVIQFGE